MTRNSGGARLPDRGWRRESRHSAPSGRWDDAWVLTALLLASVAFLHLFEWSTPPAEDAAILMRYAVHLAEGHGLVWNVGEPPVDGATDFLFVVMVTALVRLGVDLGDAVLGLAVMAHLLTVLIVYAGNRWLWGAAVPVAALSALYVAACTGPAYAAAYFGTPVFALSATMTWIVCLKLMHEERQPASGSWSVGFAVSALVTGIVRPEGVLLGAMMLAALVVARGWWHSRETVVAFAWVFLVCGGLYFAWRWHYFEYPLPNPYYRKSAGFPHWDGLRGSFGWFVRLAAPFLPPFLLGLRSAKATRRTIATAIPLIGFASAFILVSDETNYGGRFQYALLPMTLVCWAPFVQGLRVRPDRGSPWRRVVLEVAAATVAFVCVGYATRQPCRFLTTSRACGSRSLDNGLYAVGRLLAEYRDKGYVMAVSEAGLLPLYSGWKAVDTWGLNDAWIAHNGEVTAAYLDRYRPELVMFHAYFSPVAPPDALRPALTDPWDRMTRLLHEYAESNRYVLAAAFGDSPRNTHYYYVRSDFTDSGRIAGQVAALDYQWWGSPAVDYSRFR